MSRRSHLLASAFAATILATSPALAGGAADTLLLTTPETAVSYVFSGSSPVGAALVVSGTRLVTFGTNPSVNDCLVAGGQFNNGGGTYPAISAGWNLISGAQFVCCSAALPREYVWHQVGAGEGPSFTPFSDGNGNVYTEVFDVGPLAGGCSGHFTATGGAAPGQGPSTTQTTTLANQALVLAFGWQESSGGWTPTDPSITGNVGTGLVNNSGPGTLHVATASYGTFPIVSYLNVTCTIQGHWTGGAGFSSSGCDLVEADP